MADTTFVSKETTVAAEWCNEVNTLVHKIFANASYTANQVLKVDASGDFSVLDTAGGTSLFVDVSDNQLQIGKGLTTESASIEIGTGRTGNGIAAFDGITDATYTDYSFSLRRLNGGENENTILQHRGTGGLWLNARDLGSIELRTNNTTALTVDSSQNIGIGISTPDTNLHVWNGSAGTVTAVTNSILTIENSTSAYLSFLTPNTALSGLIFADPDDNNTGYITYNHLTPQVTIGIEAINTLRIDDDATAGNTRLLIYDVDNATLERVSVGAADSGGAGFKVLRIAN